MRIVFVISTLGSGGAEHVGINLCNSWQSMGHDISLINFEAPGTPCFYQISGKIQIRQLNLLNPSKGVGAALLGNLSRIYTLRQALHELQPDLTVAFMTETGVLCRAALLGSGLPLVISERIDPNAHPIPFIWHQLRKWTYPGAAAVVVQTSIIRDHITEITGVNAHIIPNPVLLSEYTVAAQTHSKPRQPIQISAIGRLNPQKGFDVLLQAFATLNPSAARLNIYGEGPERDALSALIRQFKLEDRVQLKGRSQDIPAVLSNTDVFVHPARYEGYPNVVIEALAAGCCVVASDDSGGGTRELLGDSQHGLLIPSNNVNALASALCAVIEDYSLRDHYRGGARQAVAHLDAPIIAEKWLTLFDALLQK